MMNPHSAFDIHEDALYSEISNARKRLTHGHLALTEATTNDSSASATSAFSELWETEIARIGDFLQAQQHNLEFSAKALLTNVEAALGRLTCDELSPEDANIAQELIETWRFKTDELVDACQKLQHFANHNKEILEEIGTYADETLLHTTCVVGLHRRFTNAPWKNGPNSSLIVVLSDIYGVIRATEKRQRGANKDNSEWVAPTCFERSTTKYWVQDEQLTDLLLAAVEEAPLLVYGKSGRLTSKADCLSQARSQGKDKLWDQLATPITSIYFDSPRMSLYKERLPRHEGAQLLRARWYGRRPTGEEVIFLELKTHHEKWINTKSVKERVAIREKDMARFLSLEEWSIQDAKEVASAASPTLDESVLNRAGDRLLRMHELVFQHGLRPCVRTCYLRAAFQSSASNALRLTIDRNITMVDETKAHQGSWCLPEDAVIQNTMATRVPFVVLEVKLAGDSPTPPVIEDLQSRGVIQEATKFSKFLTGAAAFNTDKVGMLPHWAEHPAFAPVFSGVGLAAARDPNKPPTPVVTTGVCDASKSDTTSTSSESHKLETTQFFQTNAIAASGRPLAAKGESVTRRRTNHAAAETDTEISTNLNASNNGSLSNRSFRNLATRSFRNLFQRPSGGKSATTLSIAPKKPARVEPKSYFANERTFIQWISASLLLVTISVILLGIDSEMGGQSTYATKAGIGVCAGAVMIVFYATYVYFRRLHLLSTGAPYGYIDHVGPFVLAVSVCGGVVVLLTHFLSEIKLATSPPPKQVYLHESPGQCYLHSIRGISKLEYQPSDIVVDAKRNALLVPSVQRILAHSLDPPLPNRENRVRTLVEIPDSNLEGLTVIDERVFALSEGPKRTELIELAWNNDDELDIAHRWKLSSSEEAEALAYVPDKTRRSGRLFIDVNRQIHIYNVPDHTFPSASPEDDDEDDDSLVLGADANAEPEELERIGSLNNHVLKAGLNELKISSMSYFEGIAYVLHDNEMMLRAWDLDEGDLLAEMPLPRVEGGFSKEWEGVALERREVTEGQAESLLFDRGNLRGSESALHSESQLILHLALDTPAQVWSMVVKQGDRRGELILPSCAVSAHASADSISEDESSDSLEHGRGG